MSTLLAFQRSWVRSTSAPLRFVGPGRAEVPESDYDSILVGRILSFQGVGSVERLGAYRLQYWFRLMTLLQKDFPLLGHVIGWESFNPLVMRYLVDSPPGKDPGRLGEGFVDWLAKQGARKSWIEAARVDALWNQVFEASEVARPDQCALEKIAQSQAQVVLQPSVRVVRLERDWISLRIAINHDQTVTPGLPRRMPRWWVLSRTGSILRADPIEPAFAGLLQGMLSGGSWLDALESLVRERPRGAGHILRWFGLGQQWGIWGVAAIPRHL